MLRIIYFYFSCDINITFLSTSIIPTLNVGKSCSSATGLFSVSKCSAIIITASFIIHNSSEYEQSLTSMTLSLLLKLCLLHLLQKILAWVAQIFKAALLLSLCSSSLLLFQIFVPSKQLWELHLLCIPRCKNLIDPSCYSFTDTLTV